MTDQDSKRKVEPVTGQHGDYILVPRTPTESMIKAAWADALAEDAAGVWKAMIESYENEASHRGWEIQKSEGSHDGEIPKSGS